MKSSKPGRARCQSALSRSSLRAEPPLAPCPGVRALAVASRGARCHAVSAPCHLGSRTTKPPLAFPPLSSFLRVWSRHALAITVAGAPNRARQEREANNIAGSLVTATVVDSHRATSLLGTRAPYPYRASLPRATPPHAMAAELVADAGPRPCWRSYPPQGMSWPLLQAVAAYKRDAGAPERGFPFSTICK
jgi:hypothetical protein